MQLVLTELSGWTLPIPGPNGEPYDVPSRERATKLGLHEGLPILLHDDGGMQTQTYNYEVTLTPEWKQHVVRISEFRPYNPAARGNTISPGRVRSFSLESGAGGGQILELQIDSLRVEAARIAK